MHRDASKSSPTAAIDAVAVQPLSPTPDAAALVELRARFLGAGLALVHAAFTSDEGERSVGLVLTRSS